MEFSHVFISKNNKKIRKRNLFLALIILFLIIQYIILIYAIPPNIVIFKGEEQKIGFVMSSFLSCETENKNLLDIDSIPVIENNNNIKSVVSRIVQRHFFLRSIEEGCANVKIKVFNFIPLKDIQVRIIPKKSIVACGNSVGVRLKTYGIFIIAVSNVETEEGIITPAKNLNIIPGDVILEANNEKMETVNNLINVIENSNGDNISLKILKKDKSISTISIKPCKSATDGKYKIGLWVRDSALGIGTLTFFDPESGFFGALGHGISDVDSGEIIPASSGEIYSSSIVGVKKGSAGTPGELKGVFLDDSKIMGNINQNNSYGIYGKINLEYTDIVSQLPKKYQIGLSYQIKEGPAKILTNIDGKRVEQYDILIQQVTRNSSDGTKGMVIKVIDPKLIEITGGIVQGMSGSPIIQNGCIVGAVTHVLINDPTKGFGIFIEKMLQNQ